MLNTYEPSYVTLDLNVDREEKDLAVETLQLTLREPTGITAKNVFFRGTVINILNS